MGSTHAGLRVSFTLYGEHKKPPSCCNPVADRAGIESNKVAENRYQVNLLPRRELAPVPEANATFPVMGRAGHALSKSSCSGWPNMYEVQDMLHSGGSALLGCYAKASQPALLEHPHPRKARKKAKEEHYVDAGALPPAPAPWLPRGRARGPASCASDVDRGLMADQKFRRLCAHQHLGRSSC